MSMIERAIRKMECRSVAYTNQWLIMCAHHTCNLVVMCVSSVCCVCECVYVWMCLCLHT